MENEINLPPDNAKRKITKTAILGFSVLIAAAIVGHVFNFWKMSDGEKIEKNQPKAEKTGAQQEDNNKYRAVRVPPKPQINLEKIYVDWEPKPVKTKKNCEEDAKCYLVGKITNDDPAYDEKPLYLEAIPNDMGSDRPYYLTMSDIKHYIISKDESGTEKKLYAEGELGEEDDVPISGINDIPEEINFPGSDYKLIRNLAPSYFFAELRIKKKIFSDSALGDFYLTNDGCLVAELPDHTAVAYDFILPFANKDNNTINITFNNGENNQDDYPADIPSCEGVCNFMNEAGKYIESENDLEAAGQTPNGENIYRYKDPNNKNLRDLYNDKRMNSYYTDDLEKLDKNKYSYDEFIESNPVLFWKDPLGRWIRFINRKFDLPPDLC